MCFYHMAGSASEHDKANPGFWYPGGGGVIARNVPPKNIFIGQTIKKLLIDVACSVKMAKY